MSKEVVCGLEGTEEFWRRREDSPVSIEGWRRDRKLRHRISSNSYHHVGDSPNLILQLKNEVQPPMLAEQLAKMTYQSQGPLPQGE